MAFASKKRVLLIGGEGIVLYAPSGKGVNRETSIAWDVPDFDAQLTAALVKQNINRPVAVIFDGADQAYRKEDNIPRLSPFDRPRFVKRKLEMAFPSYPIRASLEIKPPRGKRFATPSYLFIALPETEQLDRVGHALYEAGVPVAGFGLLPVESAGLVTALTQSLFGTQSRWSVLIGQHETGGLRQVVVKDGNLALARLTPTSEAGTDGPDWVAEVERGFKETLAYISRFGYTPDQGLDVAIVCGDIEKQFFDQKKLAATNIQYVTITEALRAIGGKPFGIRKGNFADALHAAWIGKKARLTLPVGVPSIHRIMAPRLGARVAGVLLVLSAIGLGAATLESYKTWLSLREELSSRRNQIVLLQREYEEETKVFDALPVRPEDVRNALAVRDLLDSNTVNISPLLQKLKSNLGPDIILSGLTFEHVPGKALPLAQQDTRQNAAPPALTPQEKADRGRVKMTFKFSLPATVPLEQKVTRTETLEQELRAAFPAWDVVIVSQFGKVSRDGQFQGQAGQAQARLSVADDYAELSLEGVPL